MVINVPFIVALFRDPSVLLGTLGEIVHKIETS